MNLIAHDTGPPNRELRRQLREPNLGHKPSERALRLTPKTLNRTKLSSKRSNKLIRNRLHTKKPNATRNWHPKHRAFICIVSSALAPGVQERSLITGNFLRRVTAWLDTQSTGKIELLWLAQSPFVSWVYRLREKCSASLWRTSLQKPFPSHSVAHPPLSRLVYDYVACCHRGMDWGSCTSILKSQIVRVLKPTIELVEAISLERTHL